VLHLKGAPFDPPISTSAIDILPGQEHLSAFTGHTNHEISGLAPIIGAAIAGAAYAALTGERKTVDIEGEARVHA
jgi:hypothetical protein